MRFGSLFSGIGGFDLGFERAGLECAWQAEIDKDCQRVLAKRFPNTERFQDVSTVGKLPAVNVICGGFPCQDLSVAGKRKGLAGERSGLWFEFLRIIEANLPRWIVIENVPGLLSSDEGRDFAAILRGLVECGYCLAWRILDAQYDGVAQRRRRVFIVGSLGDGSCAEILFESEGVSWNPPTRGEARQRVASAVTTGTGKSSGPRNGNGDPINMVIPIQEVGAREGKNQNGVGIGIGKDNDVMYTLQSGQVHGVAATLKQRGRGACDEVMDNLQIAGSLAAHSKKHGHAMTTQQAAESNHLVSMPLKAKANSSHDESHETYIYHENTDGKVYESAECPALRNFQKDAPMVTHALRSEGADASEDGTGRGTPPVVANCFNGYTGGPDDNDAQANHLIAFSSKDHGADAGEISPTLRAQNFKDSHINGGGQVAIAFGWNKSDSQTMRVDDKTTDALQSSPQSNPAIAFTERTRSEGRTLEAQEELAYAVTNPGSGGRTHSRQIAGGFGVRRLTPRECEFLQGFPADWTLNDAEGKQISDSARYRMLGNAIAVPVAEWIGKRLLEVL